MKADAPIVVTDAGIEREVRPRHPSNAHDLIVSSESGRVMLVSPEQPANTELKRMVRFLGSEREVRWEQFMNA